KLVNSQKIWSFEDLPVFGDFVTEGPKAPKAPKVNLVRKLRK
ncbi:652_t:CDS:1, partial [Racocetra persica]